MRPYILNAALPLVLLACSGSAVQGQDAGGTTLSPTKPFKATAVATFEAPWALAFLSGERILVTEKAGTMKLLPGFGKPPITVTGLPKVDSAGQGALMDVVAAPNYVKSDLIYFSFSEAGTSGKGVVLASARLIVNDTDARLEDMKILFRASPLVEGNGHYSGRIAFAPDGKTLFFTAGERQKFTPAQDLTMSLGKVLHLNLDGTPAAGNPFYPEGAAKAAIWSYGHRNLLGIVFDDKGRLWETEMGPKGGDEVNLIKRGKNYGWPNASNGSHYDGKDIPDHKPGDGYEAPAAWWNPSISPSSIAYYNAALFPAWKDSLFVGALSGKALIRLKIVGDRAVKADQWDMGARIRAVRTGPDGALWVLEDGAGGRLLRLTPG